MWIIYTAKGQEWEVVDTVWGTFDDARKVARMYEQKLGIVCGVCTEIVAKRDGLIK